MRMNPQIIFKNPHKIQKNLNIIKWNQEITWYANASSKIFKNPHEIQKNLNIIK